MPEARPGADGGALPSPQQLATLRSVLGRIGHDLSNLVTPLVAYPPLMRMDLPVGSKSGELIDAMEQTAQDIVGIARQMLDFASCGEYEEHPVNLGDTMRMVVGELSRSLPANVGAEVLVRQEGLTVAGSAEKLGRCVQRLWANAVEAMPEGGSLTVTVERLDTTVPLPMYSGEAPPGAYAVLEVRDTGKGIDPKVLPLVFLPFFTTRRDRRKRGSGLGLTYVHAITQAHRGSIDVESTPNVGTRVRLLLPLAQAIVEAPAGKEGAPAHSSAASPHRGSGTHRVLIVDDEASVRESFSMLLKSAMPGVRVDLAANGEEALNIYREGGHSVIVMDLYMPVKDGYSAFMELKTVAASGGREMPAVIFCTGYAPPRTIRDAVMADQRHVLLPKPVTARALVEAVKARLSP